MRSHLSEHIIIMSRVDNIKAELTEEIYDFLKKYNISRLNAVDVEEGYSPIIQKDYSDEDNSYTLDRIFFRDGDIVLEASGYWGGSDEFYLADVSVEVVEEVHDWLFDNEETIAEIAEEEE